jgi:hypothetical protein
VNNQKIIIALFISQGNQIKSNSGICDLFELIFLLLQENVAVLSLDVATLTVIVW